MPAASLTPPAEVEADDDFGAPGPDEDAPAAEAFDAIAPPAFAGARVDQAIARWLPEQSRARLQQWIRDGRVTVDGRTVRASHRLHGGETLHIRPGIEPAVLAAQPEAIALRIVYEDASVLVIDKPAGLVVHPGAGHAHGTLVNALLHHDPAAVALPRAGIVHRLDKDTSGLMVVARTITAHTALVRALAARQVRRVYQAIACGRLAAPTRVDAPIGRHPTQRTRMAVVPGGRPALTDVRPLGELAGAIWVECRLSTGRTHQIRVHLASIGLPLLGDPVYGPRPGRLPPALAAVGERLGRQALHAVELGFAHPDDGRPLEFRSALPEDIQAAIDALAPSASARPAPRSPAAASASPPSVGRSPRPRASTGPASGLSSVLPDTDTACDPPPRPSRH